jgi:hypothetical protein
LALVASAIAFIVAQPILRDHGYVAPRYPAVSITDAGAARAVIGTALLLTAYALIALGIGTVLRHSGATIASAIALIDLPVLIQAFFAQYIRTGLEQFTPLAGMAIQSTTDRMLSAFHGGDRGMPIAPWAGLAVTFTWALALLGIGYARLRTHDA